MTTTIARPRHPLLLPLALIACGLAAAASPAALAADAAGLAITDAWVRSVGPSRPAAGYFTLSNQTDQPRALVAAQSPGCGELMLHRSLHENGKDRMEMVAQVAVAPRDKVSFAPGGYHLMCMSPTKDVTPGHTIPVTLRFADGATITTDFPVRTATGK